MQSVDRHDVEDLLARLRTRFPTERYVDLGLWEKMRKHKGANLLAAIEKLRK